MLLLSAGIGATPLLAMLHALVQAGSTREVWWMHGARNGAEHAFAAEVAPCSGSCPTPGATSSTVRRPPPTGWGWTTRIAVG